MKLRIWASATLSLDLLVITETHWTQDYEWSDSSLVLSLALDAHNTTHSGILMVA